jgi:hypothetical protein
MKQKHGMPKVVVIYESKPDTVELPSPVPLHVIIIFMGWAMLGVFLPREECAGPSILCFVFFLDCMFIRLSSICCP